MPISEDKDQEVNRLSCGLKDSCLEGDRQEDEMVGWHHRLNRNELE